ncbi:MAG TPA: LysM peptidoglycan-binding domain-containing protein [Chloroflexota bacterium]|nr:LysM peptidoglycan-binding domain-containing protein [Chloroflexota bacterium]
MTILDLPSHRRPVLATLASLALSGATLPTGFSPQPAEAYTPNCVNVVLRDAFWGQFRRAIESGANAAGVPDALARAGFAVTSAPSVGAVISWPAGAYGASSVGHVGIVTSVYENGSVLVRHENWPYGSGEHLQVFAVRPGFRFVHRPEATTGVAPTPHDASAASAAESPSPPAPSGTEHAPETRGTPETRGMPGERIHTIQRGDTLFATARRYGTTVDALVAANGLGAPTAILSVGQHLVIP